MWCGVLWCGVWFAMISMCWLELWLVLVVWPQAVVLSRINMFPVLLWLQWSVEAWSDNRPGLCPPPGEISSLLSCCRMSRVLSLTVCCLLGAGLVLSQEGSGSLPAGQEEILQYPYTDTFSCEGQGYGYYADVDSGCQVWGGQIGSQSWNILLLLGFPHLPPHSR